MGHFSYRSTIKPVPFVNRPVKPQGIAPMTSKHVIIRRGPHRSHNGPMQSRATIFLSRISGKSTYLRPCLWPTHQ